MESGQPSSSLGNTGYACPFGEDGAYVACRRGVNAYTGEPFHNPGQSCWLAGPQRPSPSPEIRVAHCRGDFAACQRVIRTGVDVSDPDFAERAGMLCVDARVDVNQGSDGNMPPYADFMVSFWSRYNEGF